MDKVDFMKKYKDLYLPTAKAVSEVTVPAMQFLMIDGQGDPNGEAFQQAVGALYSVAFSLKFWPKKHPAPEGYFEYSVPPLEGLWWIEGVDDPIAFNLPKDKWCWTAMIMQPEFVTPELVEEVKREVAVKKPSSSLKNLRLEPFNEGKAVQIMHIGPYSEEGSNVQKLVDYMSANGYRSNGKHHEIYLGDPRRTAPEKLRTVLRHPIA